jgi:cbb3-type cytochrome oxidase subunit 3
MIRELMTHNVNLLLILAGLVAFCVLFIITIAKIFRPSAKEQYDKYAQIPLTQDQPQ